MFRAEEVTKAVADRTVGEWLAGQALNVVHVGIFDTSGTLREKRLSAAAATRALQDGWSFVDAIEWWDPADQTWRAGGSEHQPATVDPESGRPYPFEQNAGLFIADFDGPLRDLSPRAQLARIVDRARELAIEVEVGWEFECIVLNQEEPLVPAMTTNRCWSALTAAAEAETLNELASLLGKGAVPVDHLCAELGPGCLELAIQHGPAMRSADDAALAKLFTKAFFQRRSQTATFMAQVGEGFPGLGGHPSLSFRSTTDGQPLLTDGPGELTKTAMSAIAGVVAGLPELLLMAAPNPNSYRRYAPGNWAPSTATWGIGNYSCGLRVVADRNSRLELRVPGADTNPHLCLAMFLGAAILGIEQDMQPPPPVNPPADGRLADSPLPKSLMHAIERFATSPAALELFGNRFVDHYVGSRTAEEEACRRFVPVGERNRYLHDV
jgi:glutamine synthetase